MTSCGEMCTGADVKADDTQMTAPHSITVEKELNEKELAKLKIEQAEGAETETDDSGYVKFIRRPVPAEPETIAIVHAPDRLKQARAVEKFATFFDHLRQKKTTIDIVDILECNDEEKFELLVETIGNADRIILVGSKNLTKHFENRENNEKGTFDNAIWDLIGRILKELRKPGHDRVFAVYFEYSGKGEIPRDLVNQFGRIYELSCEEASTIETFYGRLLHRKGVVSFPDVRNLNDCGPGKKLCRSVKDALRDLQHMSLILTLIQHGESMGFCEDDFVKNCLDILLQEAVISQEDYWLIRGECTLKKRVAALVRLVRAKETHVPEECEKLIEVWNHNVQNDTPKRCLVANRVTLIEGLMGIGPTLDFLQQEMVISGHVASTIRNERTDEDKARHLLDCLPNTRPAVTKFREALMKHYPWLAELIDHDSSDEDELQSL